MQHVLMYVLMYIMTSPAGVLEYSPPRHLVVLVELSAIHLVVQVLLKGYGEAPVQFQVNCAAWQESSTGTSVGYNHTAFTSAGKHQQCCFKHWYLSATLLL